ncbi:MAG: hypothetical protein R3F36_16290 [Candidatus Competibacteraceae bacterium]
MPMPRGPIKSRWCLLAPVALLDAIQDALGKFLPRHEQDLPAFRDRFG